MSSLKNNKIALKLELIGDPPCSDCVSEDFIYEFLSSVRGVLEGAGFSSFIQISRGQEATSDVFVSFAGDGEFSGLFFKAKNESINLFPRNEIVLFKGSPSSLNPGPGYTIQEELTRSALGQSSNRDDWTAFYACRDSLFTPIE